MVKMSKEKFIEEVRARAHTVPNKNEWIAMFTHYNCYKCVSLVSVMADFFLLKGQEAEYLRKRRFSPEEFDELVLKYFPEWLGKNEQKKGG